MNRALTFVAMLLVACSAQPSVPNCDFAAAPIGEAEPSLSFVGAPVSVTLFAPTTVFCATDAGISSDVTVEVFDASNRAVIETHTSPRKELGGFSVDVTFTPSRAGQYVITARFEPTIAPIRRTHVVVEDHTAQTPELISAVDAGCERVHPLGATLLCQADGDVTLWLDGGVVGSLFGSSYAAGEGVAWVRSFGTLTHLQVVDGGVRQTARTMNASGDIGFDAQQWVEANGASIQFFSYVDGGVSERRRDAVFDGRVNTGAQLAVSGEHIGWHDGFEACALASTASVAMCRGELYAEQVMAERDVLWLKPSTSLLQQWRVAASGVGVLREVPLSPLLVDVPNEQPLFTWSGRYVTVRRESVTLEVWPRIDQVATVTVTPSRGVQETEQRSARVPTLT